MLAVYAQYPTFTVFLAVFLGALVTMVLMPFWIRGLKKHLICLLYTSDAADD